MMAQQLHALLQKHGCVKIESIGQPFDPHFHEAISQQPTTDCDPGTVVLEALPGYQLQDRVIRPSQVIVASTPPE